MTPAIASLLLLLPGPPTDLPQPPAPEAEVSPAPQSISPAPQSPSQPINPPDWELIPLSPLRIGNRQALIPDWRQVGFISFPPFSQPGTLGNRAWERGDTIDQILTLGDVQDSLLLQNFSIGSIAKMMNWKLEEKGTLSLADFKLMERQTIQSLAVAVPSLLAMPLNKLQPIEDLIRLVSKDPGVVSNPSAAIGELLQRYPELGAISFQHLDLSQYEFTALPNLEEPPLRAFSGWETAAIADIPGLNQIPWVLFPGQLNLSGEIALSSFQPAGAAAQSKGDCSQVSDCPSIPSIKLQALNQGERSWVLGDFQVEGGDGDLARLNDGLEPAGLLPFGPAFKVVLMDVSNQAARSAIYFRACHQVGDEKSSLSCSPYAIGPIPFMSFLNGSAVFVGMHTEADPSLADLFPVAVEAPQAEPQTEASPSPVQAERTPAADNASASPSFSLFSFLTGAALISVVGCGSLLIVTSRKRKPS